MKGIFKLWIHIVLLICVVFIQSKHDISFYNNGEFSEEGVAIYLLAVAVTRAVAVILANEWFEED